MSVSWLRINYKCRIDWPCWSQIGSPQSCNNMFVELLDSCRKLSQKHSKTFTNILRWKPDCLALAIQDFSSHGFETKSLLNWKQFPSVLISSPDNWLVADVRLRFPLWAPKKERTLQSMGCSSSLCLTCSVASSNKSHLNLQNVKLKLALKLIYNCIIEHSTEMEAANLCLERLHQAFVWTAGPFAKGFAGHRLRTKCIAQMFTQHEVFISKKVPWKHGVLSIDLLQRLS